MSFVFLPPACDDECTGLLLNDLDRLNQMMLSVNLSGPLPAPYRMLHGFENMTQELKVWLAVFTYINNRASVHLYLILFNPTAVSRFREDEKFKI